MSRLNTTPRFNGGESPRRALALHRQAEHWQVVLAENRSGRLHVAEHHSIAVRDAERLAALVRRADPDRLVVVLPGGSVVCRVLEAPALDDAAATQAAELQAEADLPSVLAPHRRRCAVLPWRTPVDNRLAAAFGWPGRAPECLSPSVAAPTYAAEAAALLELLILCGAGEGTIASLDRDHHSIELASHVNGLTTVRTARLSEDRWSAEAARVMVETALSAGADDAALADVEQRASDAARSHRQCLLADADCLARLARMIPGTGADAAWWSRFGVAAGAALAALGPRRAMTELLDEPPQPPRGAILSMLTWLGDRAHARGVALAAILLIVVAPVLGGWSRYAILQHKTRQLDEVSAAARERKAEADFFRTLRRHRWPMTKILADVAGMAPYDLTFESINIDSTSGITISGSTSLEHQGEVFDFHGLLLTSRLFSQVKSPNVTSGENKIEFELQATVQDAHAKVERPHNEPLAVVLYGEEARGKPLGQYIFSAFSLGSGSSRPRTPSSGPTRGPVSTPGPLDGGSSGNDFSFPGLGTGDDGSSRSSAPRGGSPAERPLPPPLSDAEIAKMDLAAVNKAMVDRASVKHREQRLQDEYDKLLQRRRELSNAGMAPARGGQP